MSDDPYKRIFGIDSASRGVSDTPITYESESDTWKRACHDALNQRDRTTELLEAALQREIELQQKLTTAAHLEAHLRTRAEKAEAELAELHELELDRRFAAE